MGFIDSKNVSFEQYTTGVAPLVSLSAKSATSSVPVALDGVVIRQNAVMVVTTSAGVSAGSVQMQGSLDGTNWFSIGSPVTTSAASTTTVATSTSAFARFVRAVIATTITGGTVTVSVGLSG
jgi:hypothetical protein